MHTKCPECNSVFRITTELLEMADGLVRCGICDAVFNGTDYIQENDPPQDNTQEELQDDLKHSGHTQDFVSDEDEDIDDFSFSQDDIYDGDTHDHQDDENTLIHTDAIPTVIKEDMGSGPLTKTNNTLQIAMWTLGSIALALFFLGQITYWNKVDVLPRTWVNNFCNVIGCQSNVKRDLSALRILNRNIFTHPNVKNALMVTTSFVNESDNIQPFPLLQVALLNTQGEIVAIRRFAPTDYLVNRDLIGTDMQPDEPVGARLEVFDPGSTVIAYEIDFY